MSVTPIDPEPCATTSDLHLWEIARELAELLEKGRHDDESWSLDFWRLTGSYLQVTFRISSGQGESSWSVQHAVNVTTLKRALLPFHDLRYEVELAYRKLRARQ